MSTNPLVSIMIPVFQGEDYISRCLESVLNQTYKNIEAIVVNDGSTDKTEDIVKSFINIFESREMKLIYKRKCNGGQSSAINEALKLVSGEYVAWFDSDDMLHPQFVERLLTALKEQNTFFSFSKIGFVKEKKLDKYIFIAGREKPAKEDYFFEDLILEKNIIYGSGSCLVKTSHLFERLQKKSIFDSKEGQNWQLMLPIVYKTRCAYVDEVLCKIVIRKNSHSRKPRNKNEQIERNNNFIILLENTIDRIDAIPISEKQHFHSIIKNKYLVRNFEIGYKYGDKKIVNFYYKAIKEKNISTETIEKKYKILCKSRTKIPYYINKINVFICVFINKARGKIKCKTQKRTQ